MADDNVYTERLKNTAGLDTLTEGRDVFHTNIQATFSRRPGDSLVQDLDMRQRALPCFGACESGNPGHPLTLANCVAYIA